MKNGKLYTTLLIGFGVVCCCFAAHQEKVRLNGAEKLYADLTKNGHLEHVTLQQYCVPVMDGTQSKNCMLARIIVSDDEHRVIWQGPRATDKHWGNDARILVFSYGDSDTPQEASVLLEDLDGDGNHELCVDSNVTADGVYSILRWEKGKFVDTGRSVFEAVGKGAYKMGSVVDRNQDALYNLRRDNGKLLAEFRDESNTMKTAAFVVDKQGILRFENYVQ